MWRGLAFATMFVDHAGLLLAPGMVWPCVLGRMAFPLFAWMVGRGSALTRNAGAYGVRLVLLAVVSQPVFSWAVDPGRLNVCFTLAVGFGIWRCLQARDCSGVLVLVVLAGVVPMDYGLAGVLFVAACCAAVRWSWPVHLGAWLAVAWPDAYGLGVGLGVLALSWAVPGPSWPVLRGRLWYGFYPLHLCALAVLAGMSNGL